MGEGGWLRMEGRADGKWNAKTGLARRNILMALLVAPSTVVRMAGAVVWAALSQC